MGIKVLECVCSLMEEVKDLTGKEVKFIMDENQASMAEVKTAREKDEFHLIKYSKNYSLEINHIIASKLIQILRTYKTNPKERVMAVAYQEHINNARMAISVETETKPHLEIALNDPQLTSTWVLSLINQLISQPVNINIEKIIYSEYPELREFQKNVITHQFKDFNATLTKEVQAISPSLIYDTSAIMNYVYLRFMDDIIGSDFIGNLNFIVKKAKSNRLYNYTKDNLENSFTSDIGTIKYWAEELNITNWFTWTDFENV